MSFAMSEAALTRAGSDARLKVERYPVQIPQNTEGVQALLTQQNYVSDRALATVVLLSLKLGRPLFLEGKTVRAVAAGFSEKRDFYRALHACQVNRPEHRRVFAPVFRLFWRDPRFVAHMMSLMLPARRGVQQDRTVQSGEKRAAEALLQGTRPDLPAPGDQPGDSTVLDVDATLTMSRDERLRTLDFEQMSTAETQKAMRMLSRLRLPVKPLILRRTQAHHRGKLADWRNTLRKSLRTGAEIHDFSTKNRRQRWPNLVVICDISGSMSRY